MTDEDIEKIAHKVADILEQRFNERQYEMTERAMDLLWNTPMKTLEDYRKER